MNEEKLDLYVKAITEIVGENTIKESYINQANSNMPTLIIDKEKWHEASMLLHDDNSMRFDYIMNLSGVDYTTYMEVIYHLYSFSRDEYITVKVQTDREGGGVPSVIDIWPGADWQERETYDLLGIYFNGREISRILLPDDWVGHPLRKDYVPYDEGV